MTQTRLWTPDAPIDFAGSIDRYRRWGPDLATVVADGTLLRVSADGVPYRVRQRRDGAIEVAAPSAVDVAMAETRYRLAESLSLDPVRRIAERVPVVAEQLSVVPGYRPPMNNGVMESLVASICAQQVNLTWAATTRSRLVERYGVRHELGGVAVWQFPSADALAGADVGEIRAMQFTQRKSEYIVGTAAEVAAGHLEGLDADDDQTVIQRITAVRGLGRWTAEWFLARTLARPHAIAAGDLGVRKAVSYYVAGTEENLPEDEVRRLTADWGAGGNWAIHLLLERLVAG